jgi:uncharacterized membrane protein
MENSKKQKLQKWLIPLSIIGLIDASYLSIIKLTNNQLYCAPGLGNCGAVTSSKYAEIYGIPLSVIGLVGYLAILATLFLMHKADFFKTYGGYVLFGLTLIGFLFSMYLTYLQFGVLHEFCPYCLLSAVLMTCSFVISILIM